jgi:hypothetical protein
LTHDVSVRAAPSNTRNFVRAIRIIITADP